MTVELTEFSSIWWKQANQFADAYALLLPQESGIGDRTLVAPSVTVIRGRNADGNFVELATTDEAPTDADSFQLDFYGQYDAVHALDRLFAMNEKFYIQLRSYAYPPVDVEALATKVEHYLCIPSGATKGGGRNLDASGGLRTNNIQVAATGRVEADLGVSISRVTTASDQNGMFLLNIDRPLKDRTKGYRGPDQVLYYGIDDTGAAPGEVWVSINAGATWAAITTDPTPWADNVGIDNGVYNFVSDTQFRLLVSRETVAATAPGFAYVDMTFGSEDVAASWTQVLIAAGADTEVVEAMLWEEASRLYIASAGDIYLSTDLGETDPGAAIFTGGNAIAKFFYDNDMNVWAIAAANAIIVELANARGAFVTRVGPSGGGAFTAIARADNGVLYAGNGTAIYRSTNEARTAGGWTSSKDFGANHIVTNIFPVKGSSEIVYAIVSDGTANLGDVWRTTNGGVDWTQVTTTANKGYTDAVASKVDPNLFYIIGDINTTTWIDKVS